MRIKTIILCVSILTLAQPIFAKLADNVQAAVRDSYQAAEWHRGLESAQAGIESAKLFGYGVLEVGAIPAEKAYWYITNQDYQYRNSVVYLGEGRLKTRRGKVYTYLDAGTVMLIAEVKFSGNRVFIKLLSPEIYNPEARKEKHPSRVGVSLEFKVDKELRDDPAGVLQGMAEWVKPFPDRLSAETYAAATYRNEVMHVEE